MSSIKWHVESRKLVDLSDNPKNPRILTKKGLVDLKKSIGKFGLAEPIVINTDNQIIGGHARVQAMMGSGIFEVDCYVPDRLLTEDENHELNVRLNKNIAGEWDMDKLHVDFNTESLLEWGFTEKELAKKGENEKVQPEVDFAEELLEANNYIVLKFTNEVDWLYLQTLYPLPTVKSKMSWYNRRGIGRVADGVKFLRTILGEIDKEYPTVAADEPEEGEVPPKGMGKGKGKANA